MIIPHDCGDKASLQVGEMKNEWIELRCPEIVPSRFLRQASENTAAGD
ncbi:hypothetical protein [Rhizobium sp. BK602]|nr:hypothetical protein [Rhizobium sp. BK602]MBB3610277.1 hypothetical protein [Rhizobium sp. BK602]